MQRHVRPYYLSGTGYVQITVDIYKVQNCVTYFLIPVRLYLKILRLVFVLHVIVYLFLIITDKVSAETSSALPSYLTLIRSSPHTDEPRETYLQDNQPLTCSAGQGKAVSVHSSGGANQDMWISFCKNSIEPDL